MSSIGSVPRPHLLTTARRPKHLRATLSIGKTRTDLSVWSIDLRWNRSVDTGKSFRLEEGERRPRVRCQHPSMNRLETMLRSQLHALVPG